MDTLGLNGGCAGILPVAPRMRCCGPAYTLEFARVPDGEPSPAADYIDNVPEGR
ncbi:MAG: hypothetical protein FWD17_17905 [Polyangiaceae bacterium]|nr:hypothetical protein [Polyangiaceae bacterium]